MKKSGFIFALALAFLAGVFSSCTKEEKSVLYSFYCDVTDRTAPSLIEDPALREVYTQYLADLMDDLSKLNLNSVSQETVINNRFGPEDKKQTDRYDASLPEVKALEAKYRKRIEDMDASSGLAFIIHVAFRLTRYTPVDASSTVSLRDYSFNLSCGYGGFRTL